MSTATRSANVRSAMGPAGFSEITNEECTCRGTNAVADEFVEVMPIREAGETFNHWLDRCRDTMGDLTSEAGHKLAKFGNVYFREQTEPGAVGAITGTGETP